MNKKVLNILVKITIILSILIICSYSSANAFSFGFRPSSSNNSSNIFKDFFGIFFNNDKNENYDLQNLKTDLENLRKSGNYNINDISDLINKLPQGEDKVILNAIKDMFVKFQEALSKIDLKGLLDKLIDAITSLIGGGSNSSGLPVNAQSINMTSITAGEFAGKDYEVNLHANIYKHVDENGNEDSDKWVVLIHPFMLNGSMIASKIGPYYYEKGYNIIAPDLRSFGDSEGEVALGFLESLDIYDWLNLLNNNYDVSQVIVHGVSLGGATTNFLSGIDQFINNGPTKINTKLKSLKELNVIGLVEDCGYTDMTQFANKDFLLSLNIGLNEDNFEYYSQATNSLQYCDLPILIIQGTNDTTVKPENAETVKNTVKGKVDTWLVDGGAHAFIIMGINSDEYKEHVQSFIDECEQEKVNAPSDNTNSDNSTDITIPSTPNTSDRTETERKAIWYIIKNWFNR